MLVTLFGITVFIHPESNVLDFVSMIALQLFLLSYFLFPCSTFIDWRLGQYFKIVAPISVTDFGIVIEVRLEQPSKASLPILVTLLPIVAEVMLSHPEKAFAPMIFTLLGIVVDFRLLQFRKA